MTRLLKIDYIKWKDAQKRFLKGLCLVSVFLCVYTILFVLPSLLVSYINKPKKTRVLSYIIRIICVAVCAIGIIWIYHTDYGIEDFYRPYLNYIQYAFLIDNPGRWIIAAIYGLYFSFYSHLLREGVQDWVVQEKKAELEKLLPAGRFNYENRYHLMLLGTSGAGKGVILNHIARFCCRMGIKLIMISAKLARTDKYSQLAYCRKLAESFGLKLYIASMDEAVADRMQYNPYAHLKKSEIKNSLGQMIKTDSYYYEKNFKMWVGCIYNVLREFRETVSISNILALYEYKDYESFLLSKKDEGLCDEELFEKYTSERIKNYAKIAQNDAANLQDVCDGCEEVFNPTPNGLKFNITDAIKEDAIIYFDLNGNSAEESTRMLGGGIMAEIQHLITAYPDSDVQKTVICDESSFYMSPLFKSCLNESRSAGYQFIISSQGPSDFQSDMRENANQLISQLSNNCRQFLIMNMNSKEDSQMGADLIGTRQIAESTHRAESIDYSALSSNKAVDVYPVNPNMIRNMPKLTSVYYEKQDNDNLEPEPVLVKWSYKDL